MRGWFGDRGQTIAPSKTLAEPSADSTCAEQGTNPPSQGDVGEVAIADSQSSVDGDPIH